MNKDNLLKIFGIIHFIASAAVPIFLISLIAFLISLGVNGKDHKHTENSKWTCISSLIISIVFYILSYILEKKLTP